jgi:hypothetical protein
MKSDMFLLRTRDDKIEMRVVTVKMETIKHIQEIFLK